ncbi:MAG: ChaB family protein [Planctomycetota bacterium]
MNRILESAYAAALKAGRDKEAASRIAWAAAKKRYFKQGGRWVRRK